MSSGSFNVKRTSASRRSWASIAFLVESVLLLVFLVASIAVLAQLLMGSLNRSTESRMLDAATIATSSVAERFAADPTHMNREVDLGNMRVVCTVEKESHANGTLYKAHIAAYAADGEGEGAAGAASAASGEASAASAPAAPTGEPLFALDTAKYEPKEP